jgi:hypothetical protein
MHRFVFAITAGLALIAGTSCTKSVIAACTPFTGPTFRLVYPVDGATSVPDAPTSIVFEKDQGIFTSGAQLVLTPPTGPSIVSGPIGQAPSPLPTPNSSPSPGTIIVGFTVPALAAGTLYKVSFNGTYVADLEPCLGSSPITGAGSFTTH